MRDLRELYQSVIVEHARAPRNFRNPDDADLSAHGDNPMCGDQLTVYLRFSGRVVADAAFVGQGCAICLASGSLMTELLRGRTAEQSERLCAEFEQMCRSGQFDPDAVPREDVAALEELLVFCGVHAFPVRIQCATLPWDTMREALQSDAARKSGVTGGDL
jgi:nitrogen fixation NifU-like protein